MDRVVIAQTGNEQKLAECQDILGRYGVTVVQDSSSNGGVDGYGIGDIDRIRDLFNGSDAQRKVIAVIREWSDIFRDKDDVEPVDPHDLQTVVNRTRLQVWSLNDTGALRRKDYEAVVPGYIDFSRRPADSNTFGWDDIFVSSGTQLSNDEMRVRGLKRSGRDQVLAQWVGDRLHYRKRQDHFTQPQNQTETIDFSKSIVDILKGKPHFSNPEINRWGVGKLINAALNRGIFMRAGITRRETNYWLTSGNAGMPYTARPDEVHEETYMTHDLFHFLIQELIFDGETDSLSREIYILHRMMGEAMTMVMADMLFIDTLAASGVEYDYSKRPIYAFFKTLNVDPSDPDVVKKLLHANVRYVLHGDDSEWVALGASGPEFEKFKIAASHFAIPDYEWTNANFDTMARSAPTVKKWSESTKPLEQSAGEMIDTQTVTQFKQLLEKSSEKPLSQASHTELSDLIFNEIFESTIAPHLSPDAPEVKVDKDFVTRKAFLKYLKFQLYIFDVYDFVPESAIYRERILSFVGKNVQHLDLEMINRIRGFYSQFVTILFERNIIDKDDHKMYQQIFPMFPPFYINYGKNWKEEKDIARVSQRVLGKSPQQIGHKPVLGSYRVGDMEFQQASDLHWNLDGKYGLDPDTAVRDLAERIINEQQSDTLFLLGDLFDGEDPDRSPKDTSAAVNELLRLIAPHFKRIIFVPGNHDLRRMPQSVNPWKDFSLPANVIMPQGATPLVENIHGVHVLIGNLGYDMNFIDPTLLGLTREQIIDFYAAQTTDGKGLLMGKDSVPFFEEMTRNMAAQLTPDIDVVATHVAPHPCVVKFRAPKRTREVVRIMNQQGLDFITNEREDDRLGAKYGATGEQYRNYWNMKSFFMGSNILDPALGGQPRPNLTLLYGHNHRGAERLHVVNGELPIRLITHQRGQWNIMK